MRTLTWMLPVVILTLVAVAPSTLGPRSVEAGPKTPPVCRAELDARGAELARLRAEPATADIPFIFITSSTEIEDVRLGYMLGADEYIRKPISGDELVTLVARRLKTA